MKRFFGICMALVLVVTLVFSTAAVDSGEKSEAEVRQYALQYMQGSQPEKKIELNRFETLYAVSGEVSGYYATFCDGTEPAGYLLMSLRTNGSPVVELAFEGPGLIESSGSATAMSAPAGNGENRIIFERAGELFVPVGNGSYYSIYGHELVPEQEVQEIGARRRAVDKDTWTVTWNEAHIDDSTVFKIQNFGSGTDYFLMNQFDNPDHNCVPTAGTNILWYWGAKRGCSSVTQKWGSGSNVDKAERIFIYLSRGMGTDPMGTTAGNIQAGFKNFFGTNPVAGGTWNFVEIPDGSYLPAFEEALNNNCPILLVLKYWDKDSKKEYAHALFNFGYAKGTDQQGYLFVMDGYYSYGRFVKHGEMENQVGYKVWVK